MKSLLNLFVEFAANDQATYSEWNNTSDVNRAIAMSTEQERCQPNMSYVNRTWTMSTEHERCQPNMSDVNRTATSEQGWRRKEPTPRRKQSTNAK